jgi:hypothetical protein
MRFRPWRRQLFELDHRADGESIIGRKRPLEPTAECPALAKGPAAKHQRNVNPAPNRDVGPQPRGNRSNGEARAASDPDGLPSWRPGEMATRDRDDRIRLESERGPGSRAFKECGVLVIANDSIRDRGRQPVGGTTRWNPKALEAWPSAILDRGPAAALDNLDHDVGTKRS